MTGQEPAGDEDRKARDVAGIKLGPFGQYELLRHLRTEGELVECFLARQRLLDREVEVHVLRVPRETNPTLSHRFLEGLERMAGLDHPALLRILDIDTSGSRPFFTTPSRGERRLAEHLATSGGSLRAEDAVRLFTPLAQGLAVLHRAGILYRETSAETVHHEPRRDLLFFGEFPLSRPETLIDSRGSDLLSPLHGQLWDERADVFLLARLLYLALVGRDALGTKALPGRAPMLKPLMDALDNRPEWIRLRDLVMASLSPSPSDRPETVEAFLEKLGKPAPTQMPPSGEHRIQVRPGATGAPAVPALPPVAAARSARGRKGRRTSPKDGRPDRGSGLRLVAALAAGAAFAFMAASTSGPPRDPQSAEVVELTATPSSDAGATEASRLEPVRAGLETALFRVNARATGTETFDERWGALMAWLATPEARHRPVTTPSALLLLRARARQGDRSAWVQLDAWIREAASVPAATR